MEDERNEALITYFDQQARVACDRQCHKAWGRSSRPRVAISDSEDDYFHLADGELGDAPAEPGTYEGNHTKPISPYWFPNKWCVRECERCAISLPGKYALPLALPDWSERRANIRDHLPVAIEEFRDLAIWLLKQLLEEPPFRSCEGDIRHLIGRVEPRLRYALAAMIRQQMDIQPGESWDVALREALRKAEDGNA